MDQKLLRKKEKKKNYFINTLVNTLKEIHLKNTLKKSFFFGADVKRAQNLILVVN